MKSKPYYLDLSRYIKDIYKLAEENDESLGQTIKLLIIIGLYNLPKD